MRALYHYSLVRKKKKKIRQNQTLDFTKDFQKNPSKLNLALNDFNFTMKNGKNRENVTKKKEKNSKNFKKNRKKLSVKISWFCNI